ncbi:Tn3 family transposase [Salinisphaera shabanensis T35B1]
MPSFCGTRSIWTGLFRRWLTLGKTIDETLLPHLSPLGWEHINLTGDYIWQQDKRVERGRFRPLRTPREP